MDQIEIQLQDTTGNWRTYMTTMNQPQLITIRMRELKSQHPKNKVRAIDANGRLIDLL